MSVSKRQYHLIVSFNKEKPDFQAYSADMGLMTWEI